MAALVKIRPDAIGAIRAAGAAGLFFVHEEAVVAKCADRVSVRAEVANRAIGRARLAFLGKVVRDGDCGFGRAHRTDGPDQ